jgi:polyisoprenyl-phosphate glycosyltransferase
MKSSEPLKLILCIPIYNDWASALQLIPQIDKAFSSRNEHIEILFVDDGSSKAFPEFLDFPLTKIFKVEILKLRRNLGHQRAIAIGLCFIQANREPDAVIVMDGDGEDPPKGVIQLTECYMNGTNNSVVFAERVRRAEGFIFKTFYQFYRVIHYCLTGNRIRVGNFSLLPKEQLERLVCVAELWNHYAASIFISRIPFVTVPVKRDSRILGESKMNFTDLVIHGLSSIAVFGDTVTVRLMIAATVSAIVTLLGLGSIIFIQNTISLSLPSWFSYMVGMFAFAFFQILIILMIITITNLQNRSSFSFLPARDFNHFINKLVSLDIN